MLDLAGLLRDVAFCELNARGLLGALLLHCCVWGYVRCGNVPLLDWFSAKFVQDSASSPGLFGAGEPAGAKAGQSGQHGNQSGNRSFRAKASAHSVLNLADRWVQRDARRRALLRENYTALSG